MKGLAVVDGDLMLSGNDYFTISGATRIRQDLNFALNDEYGSDPYHPYWGSILDRFIGQPLTASLQQQVTNEVRRVISNYIAVQADGIRDNITYNVKGLYDTSDVVQTIDNISVAINYDTISITVSLTTMSQDTITLTRQVTA